VSGANRREALKVSRMSRFPGLALAAALIATTLPAAAAQAAEPAKQVKPAFGNTVLSIYPDGRSQKIWMHPDGTWEGQSRRGTPLAGSWNVKDGKVCMKQSKPPTLPLAYCTPFPENTYVGVSWTSKDMSGTPIQLKVVQGMVTATQAK
jgi:opacity protein-like surface antigen